VVAWRRFLLLFPDSGLVDRARIALARLELSLGNANQVLLDLAEAVDEARGTTGTTLRGLAFEAACRLARDGRAAAILAREIELNGADEATAERAAALVARETEPLPPLTLREAETALATLDAPGRADEDRAGARDALERIGRRAVPLIADRIDSRPHLARESVPILEALGGEAARAVLERLAFEAAPDTAGEAVRALLRLGADAGDLGDRLLGAANAWPALRALRDATGRADAELLRKIPDLAVRLASPDPEVRALLADRLGDTGHAAAATPLGVLARGDDDPMVRLAALRALGRLGEAGVEMLLTLLDDARGPSRMSALGVLLEVAPERAAGRLPTIMDGAEPRIRAAILTIWSGRGAPGWAPEAVARLGDSDPGVRRVAETVLVKGEAADAVPAILLAYESETVDAARATRLARALGSRAGRDFGHAPGFDHAARRTVAERMRAWWVAARRE